MPGLSDFSKNFIPKEKVKKTAQTNEDILKENINAKFSKQEQSDMADTIKSNYSRLSNMNQNEMMSELIKESNRLKNNGQFNYNGLVNAIDNMGGMISQEQKQKMKDLLNQIR